MLKCEDIAQISFQEERNATQSAQEFTHSPFDQIPFGRSDANSRHTIIRLRRDEPSLLHTRYLAQE